MGKVIQFPNLETKEPIHVYEDEMTLGVIDNTDVVFIGIQVLA